MAERNSLTKDVKNIIFDMDGTLINTSLISVQACQEAALEFGIPVQKTEDILELVGWANQEFFPKLYPGMDPELLGRYSESVLLRENLIVEKLQEKLLYPGVDELLCELKSRGLSLSIASTGPAEYVNLALKESSIYSYFDEIRCGESEKIRMVEDIMKGAPKGSYVIVGDRFKDYEAAKANNIVSIAAAYGFGSKEEIEKFDLVLNQPLDLLKYLA